ncbi:MAG TPA: SRPBCC family protein [Egibacteraceae bacterium]|nr:SRPBCC family protein [Egibacteraceae bacterium]
MRPVETSVEVARPAAEVFAFVSDVTNNPRFQKGMRSCEWTSPPPVDEGSTYDQVAHFLGRDVVSKFVVDAYEPGRLIRFRSVAGPFPIVETRVVEPAGPDACRVEVTVGGSGSAFFKLADPLLRPMVAASVKRDYRRLAALLQPGG